MLDYSKTIKYNSITQGNLPFYNLNEQKLKMIWSTPSLIAFRTTCIWKENVKQCSHEQATEDTELRIKQEDKNGTLHRVL